MKQTLLAAIIFLSATGTANAELKINSFHNSNDPEDWVEIRNEAESNINLRGYKLRDTASSDVKEWKTDVFIPQGGSCVIDVKNRLNKNGDTVYLINNNGEQINCIKYGDGNEGECDNVMTSSEAQKPEQNCYAKTPEPEPEPIKTDPPTLSTPKPTQKPSAKIVSTSTPKPTLKPSTKPSATPTSTPTSTPSPEVLSESTSEPSKKSNLGITLIGLGGVSIFGSGSYIGYKEYYNRKRVR